MSEALSIKNELSALHREYTFCQEEFSRMQAALEEINDQVVSIASPIHVGDHVIDGVGAEWEVERISASFSDAGEPVFQYYGYMVLQNAKLDLDTQLIAHLPLVLASPAQ